MQSEQWRIELFSGPRVRVGEVAVDRFPTRHCGALLAIVALRPDRRHSRDDLAERLWPDEDATATRQRLRENLYQLRKLLPGGRELVLSDRESIWLAEGAPVQVDVHEYDRLLRLAREVQKGRGGEGAERLRPPVGEEGRNGEPDRQIEPVLAQAVALYTGPFAPALDWPGFDDLRRQYAQSQLESLRVLTRLLAARDPKRAVLYAEQAVQAAPLCEEAQEDLIRLYASLNRPDGARRQYREFMHALKDLDRTPSREITEFVRSLSPSSPSNREVPSIEPGSVPPYSPKSRADLASSARTWRRRAFAAVTLCALMLIVAARPWRRPPLSPDQRIKMLQDLRVAESRANSPGDHTRIARERADQCIALAEDAWLAWYGPDEDRWKDRLSLVDREIDESLDWLMHTNPIQEIQLAGALTRYWYLKPELPQHEKWLAPSTHDTIDAPDIVRARALTGLSFAYLTDPPRRAEDGIHLAHRALMLYRQHGDHWGEAQALRHIGLHLNSKAQKQEALNAFLNSLRLYEQSHSESGQALAYLCLGFVTPEEVPGTVTPARRIEWQRRCSRLFRRVGNPWGMSVAEESLRTFGPTAPVSAETFPGLIALRAELREWIRLRAERRDLIHVHALWVALGELAIHLHDEETLAESLVRILDSAPHSASTSASYRYRGRVIGAYMKFRSHDPHWPDKTAWLQRELAWSPLRSTYHRAWDTALQQGKRMSLVDAVRYASSR